MATQKPAAAATIQCPACLGEMSALDGKAGQVRKCPHCGQRFRQGQTSEDLRAQRARKAASGLGQVACPVCGGGISRQAWFCPHCGHPLRKDPACAMWALIGIGIILFVIPLFWILLRLLLHD